MNTDLRMKARDFIPKNQLMYYSEHVKITPIDKMPSSIYLLMIR